MQLGVTCIELMPVAEFAGRWGWGYDGVGLSRRFITTVHPMNCANWSTGLMPSGWGILDVVYNHVGDDGNYLPSFSTDYFTDEHGNEWGKTLNYSCEAVRQFAIDNAAYWIRDFHFDGLRLDATQNIHDPRYPTLLATLSTEARAAAGPRKIVLSAEDHLQRASLVRPVDAGGAGLDYVWNDDFPGRNRALTAVLLLGPQTPMIFMGQEFDAPSLFPYFARL